MAVSLSTNDVYNSIILLANDGTAKEDRPLGDPSKLEEAFSKAGDLPQPFRDNAFLAIGRAFASIVKYSCSARTTEDILRVTMNVDSLSSMTGRVVACVGKIEDIAKGTELVLEVL